MSLRIAVVNWSRRRAGGVESYLDFLIPQLARSGHDLALLTEVDHPADRDAISTSGAEDWCVTTAGREPALGALRAWKPDVLLVNGLADLTLEQQLLGGSPAVLIAHSYYGTCISGGKTLTFPSVAPCERRFGPACLAAFYPRRCGGLSPLTMAAQYRVQSTRLGLLRRYEGVLTLSNHMRREYLKHGCPPDRVHRLPPYVPAPDTAGFDAPSPSHRPDEIRLAFVGRLDRLKGCRVLIEALPLAAAHVGRRIVLDVAGDGPDRQACESRGTAIARAGSARVHFHGWRTARDRDRLLATADVVAVPSLWPEPYGLSGVEATAAGIPVAAFDVGAVREWLTPGVSGALASPGGGAPALARAIAEAAALGRRPPLTAAAIRAGHDAHAAAIVGHLRRASGHPAEASGAACAS
jgi:glycosyltransferase involved in cell wall biosynthesis